MVSLLLLETYHNVFGKGDSIISNNKINWKNLKKLIEEFAKNEENYCVDEMKKRDKVEKNNRARPRHKTEEEKLMAMPMV